jgi:hypothetical protein
VHVGQRARVDRELGGVEGLDAGVLLDPRLPFKLGCEPGAPAPVVTPFNGPL